VVGEAVPGNQVETFAKAGMHWRLTSGDRHVMVSERLRLSQNLVQNLKRQEEVVIVLGPTTVDTSKTVRAVEVTDVVQLNSNSWHIPKFYPFPNSQFMNSNLSMSAKDLEWPLPQRLKFYTRKKGKANDEQVARDKPPK